jgi:uncharacterized protein YuzE
VARVNWSFGARLPGVLSRSAPPRWHNERGRLPKMRTSYDPEADAMFVWFAREGTKSVATTEVAPGIMLDYDAAGNVIGIEVLDVRERVVEVLPQRELVIPSDMFLSAFSSLLSDFADVAHVPAVILR